MSRPLWSMNAAERQDLAREQREQKSHLDKVRARMEAKAVAKDAARKKN